MTRREALKRGLPVLGIFRTFAAVGVDPAIMGIGPSVAIPAALEMAGLQTDDIDLFELNEAFASQVSFSPRNRLRRTAVFVVISCRGIVSHCNGSLSYCLHIYNSSWRKFSFCELHEPVKRSGLLAYD